MGKVYNVAGSWLSLAGLKESCDSGTYQRALDVYRAQHVLDVQLSLDGELWKLDGQVKGSSFKDRYRTQVSLRRGADGAVLSWFSRCTCPVGMQCKHAVALLIKAAFKGHLWELEMHPGLPAAGAPARSPAAGARAAASPKAAQRDPDTLAREHQTQLRVQEEWRLQQAQAQALRWAQLLAQSATPEPQAAVTRLSSRTQNNESLYVMLQPENALGRHRIYTLGLMACRTRANGVGWVKARSVRELPLPGETDFDQASADWQALFQWLNGLPLNPYGYGAPGETHRGLGPMAHRVLERAAQLGALLLADPVNREYPLGPLRWGERRALQTRWVKDGSANAAQWRLQLSLEPSGGTICVNDPPLYVDAAAGLCGPIDLGTLSLRQLHQIDDAPPLPESLFEQTQGELAWALAQASLPLPPMVKPMREIGGAPPLPRLSLRPLGAELVPRLGLMQAQLRFDYGEVQGHWGRSPERLQVRTEQGPALLKRDLAAEAQAEAALCALGLTQADPEGDYRAPPEHRDLWLSWAESDYAALRDAGFALDISDVPLNWVQRTGPVQVRMAGQDDVDLAEGDADSHTSAWFDLSLGLDVGGQRINVLPWVPALLAMLARCPINPDTGERILPPSVFVPVDQGERFLSVPTDGLKPWLQTLLELVGERGSDFAGEHLRLSRLDALRATATLGEGAHWDGAERLRELVGQLRGGALAPVRIPEAVHAQLRPYQSQGVAWLQFLRQAGLGGVLADDMGLGKTLQTLAHIQIEKDAGRLDRPVLIVAPVSLMGNWAREAQRFCPQLRCVVLHGLERHARAQDLAQHDVVIAPYSLMQRDRERWMAQPWHLVVLDEAQNIKNPASQAAQVVFDLPSRNRLALSGTPMENHLGEIWSLFHFVMPGFLGSMRRFTEVYRNPIEKHGDLEATRALRARMTPFMLRRTKALVAHELPPKVESVVSVELEGAQADLYETIRLTMEQTVREALATRSLAQSQITILDAMLKLRQVCCDPRLVKLSAARKVKHSAKLEQLLAMLTEMLAEGRRILLFSQFTSMLELIEQALAERKIDWVKLTGQSRKRDEIIDRFTSGQVPLFLISLKAGGVGLNLAQADTVIHYDPWWNPAVQAQATDRAHRIGQTQSVWEVKLVAQGTIEDRILALQERKAQLAQAMMGEASARRQPMFTADDVAELFKPLGA